MDISHSGNLRRFVGVTLVHTDGNDVDDAEDKNCGYLQMTTEALTQGMMHGFLGTGESTIYWLVHMQVLSTALIPV